MISGFGFCPAATAAAGAADGTGDLDGIGDFCISIGPGDDFCIALMDDLLKSELPLIVFVGAACLCSNWSIREVVGAIGVVSKAWSKLSLELKLPTDAGGYRGKVFCLCPAVDWTWSAWPGVADLDAARVAAMKDGDFDCRDPFPGSNL